MRYEPKIIIKHKHWDSTGSFDCETCGISFDEGDYYYLNNKLFYWSEYIKCFNGGSAQTNAESSILDAFYDYYLSTFDARNFYIGISRVYNTEEHREKAIYTAINEFAVFRKQMLENELPSNFMNTIKIISIWFTDQFDIPVVIKENIKIATMPEFDRNYVND